MNKIKVFIVEDSILMQKIIMDILSSDPGIEVIGATKYGNDALKRIPKLKPDIVTLDINLPDINGLIVLRKLMEYSPVRVVMLSAYTQSGATTTMKGLELGALDFIPKPSGEVSLDLFNFKDEIIAKIKLLAAVPLTKSLAVPIMVPEDTASIKKLVIIGASTGGPKAIIDIMNRIPSNTRAAFLIVQHMPKGFTKSFAERLSWNSAIKVKESEDGDLILNGAGYVAASGYHMVLEKTIKNRVNEYFIRLDETPLVNYVRPAVDVTLSSAADCFEGDIIAVILTGMGKDGLEGVKSIKKRGAKVIVQDRETSTVYGMPKAIVDNNMADDVLPVTEISNKILSYLNIN